MKAEKRDFAGQHAVITGAASGIGQATALELARRGANITVLDIDARGAERTTERARELGVDAQFRVLDIANEDAVDAIAKELSAQGPIDLLVNNAGVAVVAPFERTSETDWDWIMGINLRGPLRLTRALLPAMIARKKGHIVMVASLAGLVGAPGMVAYSTTKFALVGFAEALRFDLVGKGVNVTTVCPGYVRTNLHHATRYDNRGFKRFLDEAPARYGMTKEHVAIALADAVVKKKPLVVLGPEKLGWWLKRIAPDTAFALARFVARRSGIADALA